MLSPDTRETEVPPGDCVPSTGFEPALPTTSRSCLLPLGYEGMCPSSSDPHTVVRDWSIRDGRSQ